MARKFKYKHRSHFDGTLLIIAKRELENIDAFFQQSKTSLRFKKERIEQRIVDSRKDDPDDLWVDDFAQLEEFAWLSSEFAIIGLWRCVELYRKYAIGHALGDDDAIRRFLEKNPKCSLTFNHSAFPRVLSKLEGAIRRFLKKNSQRPFTFNHSTFLKVLRKLKIKEGKIHCAKDVDELRCLNNAIKHERRVNGTLAKFPGWKKGDKLGDLESHYYRLRPFAKQYLEDLAKHLKTKFPPPHSVRNAKAQSSDQLSPAVQPN